MVFPTFFNLSLNLAIRSSWSEPQSAPDIVFADCMELLHLSICFLIFHKFHKFYSVSLTVVKWYSFFMIWFFLKGISNVKEKTNCFCPPYAHNILSKYFIGTALIIMNIVSYINLLCPICCCHRDQRPYFTHICIPSKIYCDLHIII